MAFDTRTFREAHRPWSFTAADGRTFTGRPVSTPQCQRYDQLCVEAGLDEKKRRHALWWILRRAFPWRFSYLIRGDPVRIILDQLEPAARRAALDDFFACLRGESPIPSQRSTQNGKRWSGATPRRTA